MRWAKRLLSIFATLLIIAFICVIYLLNTFDPNQFKHSINQALTKAIGHNTTINGNIHWSYFPRIRLDINQIDISDNHTPLAHIGQLQGGISLIDLMYKKVTIKKLYAQDLTLNIKIDVDGNNNWAQKQHKSKTGSEPNKASNKKHTTSHNNNLLTQFELKKISIQNASINLESPSSIYHFTHFNFNASNVSLKKAMSYDLSTILQGTHNQHPIAADINMNGTLRIYPFEGEIASNGIESDASFVVKHLKYNKIGVNQINATLHLDKTRYRFDLTRLNAYKGNTTGFVDFDKTNNVLLLKTNFDKLNIGKLLTDIDDIKLFDGVLTASINVNSKGKTLQGLLNKLNGQAKIDIEKGHLVDIDINGIIRWVDSLLLNKKSLESMLKKLGSLSTYTHAFTQKSTPFDILTGNTTITNGVANFENIDLSSKTLRVHGNGNISIKDQTIDFKLKAVTPDKYDAESALKKAFGRAGIPFRIHGPLTDPSVTPDTKAITESISKRLWHNVTKDFDGSFKSFNKNFKKLKDIIH